MSHCARAARLALVVSCVAAALAACGGAPTTDATAASMETSAAGSPSSSAPATTGQPLAEVPIGTVLELISTTAEVDISEDAGVYTVYLEAGGQVWLVDPCGGALGDYELDDAGSFTIGMLSPLNTCEADRERQVASEQYRQGLGDSTGWRLDGDAVVLEAGDSTFTFVVRDLGDSGLPLDRLLTLRAVRTDGVTLIPEDPSRYTLEFSNRSTVHIRCGGEAQFTLTPEGTIRFSNLEGADTACVLEKPTEEELAVSRAFGAVPFSEPSWQVSGSDLLLTVDGATLVFTEGD